MRRSHTHAYRHSKEPIEGVGIFNRALSLTGGRLSFLGKFTKAEDMQAYAEEMVQREKGWLLSQIGLIPDHDDDVMDEVRSRMNTPLWY